LHSVTLECQKESTTLEDGRVVSVIDTPGNPPCFRVYYQLVISIRFLRSRSRGCHVTG
jgi:hypothetical protein